jgi:T-complex protein 1 subunit eta
MMLMPQVILLKEGTDTSQGRPQLISNINACEGIVDAIRTTLGPRGMDKLIVDSQGKPFSADIAVYLSVCLSVCMHL